jgi:hypothetical protein
LVQVAVAVQVVEQQLLVPFRLMAVHLLVHQQVAQQEVQYQHFIQMLQEQVAQEETPQVLALQEDLAQQVAVAVD